MLSIRQPPSSSISPPFPSSPSLPCQILNCNSKPVLITTHNIIRFTQYPEIMTPLLNSPVHQFAKSSKGVTNVYFPDTGELQIIHRGGGEGWSWKRDGHMCFESQRKYAMNHESHRTRDVLLLSDIKFPRRWNRIFTCCASTQSQGLAFPLHGMWSRPCCQTSHPHLWVPSWWWAFLWDERLDATYFPINQTKM